MCELSQTRLNADSLYRHYDLLTGTPNQLLCVVMRATILEHDNTSSDITIEEIGTLLKALRVGGELGSQNTRPPKSDESFKSGWVPEAPQTQVHR